MDEVRALSALLSEFQRLVLPQTSTDPIQSLNVENERGPSLDTSSCQSADTLSQPATSLSLAQEEQNDSSSYVFPVCVAILSRKYKGPADSIFSFHLVDGVAYCACFISAVE